MCSNHPPHKPTHSSVRLRAQVIRARESTMVKNKQSRRWSTISLLSIVFWLSACAGHLSSTTDYPGGAAGKIQSRTARGGGPIFESDGRPPLTIQVPVKGAATVPVPIPQGTYSFEGRSFNYEILDARGTLHIVQHDTLFEVGDCVEFSGYADGPSRTHWSRPRVTMERSAKCQ